ncbi:MAG TPA: hypothetical protein VFN70_18070 [Burkholderiales bacterium]|nr:hypothetical protein [Burkholderiales bacterium]
MHIVANFWGWSPSGVAQWMRAGWAWPFATWGVEITGSRPPRFTRRCKVGPVCFAWGEFPEGAKAINDWRDLVAMVLPSNPREGSG